MQENNVPQQSDAINGLLKLAFGGINDAVRLLAGIGELDPEAISRLDLFGVSEIRQSKEGVLDIKFYDRLKAFELLLSSERAGNSPSASSFFGALESAAKSACDTGAI